MLMYTHSTFRVLLTYIESGDKYTWKGIFIAVAFLFATALYNFVVMRFLYHGFNSGMNLRSIITMAVYKKVCMCMYMYVLFYKIIIQNNCRSSYMYMYVSYS